MKEIPLENGHILTPFFTEAYDSCPEAFLQGVMGRGFADSLTQPSYGIIQMGDFCFLGGNGSGSQKKNILSVLNQLLKNPNAILIPLSESWNRQLLDNPVYCKKIRYALDKPALEYFNKSKLTGYISKTAYDPEYVGESVTRKFIIKPINENYYHSVLNHEWSRDFTSNYPDYMTFNRNGFGFVIIEGSTGTIAAGASSFSSSLSSIEIEVATNPNYRKKGLATAVSARMVLECIKRNKYPSWDAANLISVSIAEKLGYHFSEEYVCYILS